jgi:acyl-CoA thioester hydrolase
MFSSIAKIRVRYADTDQMKMVYHAKFFEYFEQARSDLLRDIGLPYPEIEHMGYYLPVVEAYAKYIQSARYDDLLSVKSTVKELPQVRVRIEYAIVNDESKEHLVEGYTVHSFVNVATGKPTRAPGHFLEVLTEAFKRQKKKTI